MIQHDVSEEISDIEMSDFGVSNMNQSLAGNMNSPEDGEGTRFWDIRRSSLEGRDGISMEEIIKSKYTSSKLVISSNEVVESWEYPGWGSFEEMDVRTEDLSHPPHKHQLGLGHSIAIAGNDLLASVLYTTGAVCLVTGKLSPISMLLTAIALYPFRKIFQECGTMIPLNGGVYVALLNSASKMIATFAACCSLISYSATAVVSAASCTSYAATAFGDFPQQPATIALLVAFAALVIIGVKDSANVALAIFCFHITTLLILMCMSLIFLIRDNGQILMANWQLPLPSIDGSGDGSVLLGLFLGYSVGLLGLTGFETSANYIEEAGPFEVESRVPNMPRKISIFEKTIEAMWGLVIMINPTIAILTIGVLDMSTITSNPSTVLSTLGRIAGGSWLETLVAVDAICVLAGGVLTANIGVAGLIRQLAADRCLPSFLLIRNAWFGTYHWIILGFLVLCISLYVITEGSVIVLGGVFAIAFLMVLIMFAVANMRLKYTRPLLPRGARISWVGVLTGFACMVAGLIGNIIVNPNSFYYFLIYMATYFSVVFATFQRMNIVRIALYVVRQIPFLNTRFGPAIINSLVQLKKHTVVFYTKTSELHVLNKALLYAHDNELCDTVIIAHVFNETSPKNIIESLRENLYILDHIYPKMKVDTLIIHADCFCPSLVRHMSMELSIHPSFMFIRCPGKNFAYNIGEFDGVRTIMR